jgi:hypothetical protein
MIQNAEELFENAKGVMFTKIHDKFIEIQVNEKG